MITSLEKCPVSLVGSAADSFLFLVNTLIASQCLFDTKSQYPPNHKFIPWETFDYIVVGAGSAGATAASRLAENPDLRVLLIEAGGIPSPNTEIPGFMMANVRTDMNWFDEMEPSKICKASVNERCFYSRGKVLGGSSTLNGMVYVRGNKKDFEEWGEAGNKNWDWNTVTEFFKKSQGLQSDALKGNPIYGTDGPLTTTITQTDEDIKTLIFEAAKELNQTVSEDAVFKGYYQCLSAIRNGTRCSTAKAFLSNDKIRNNLFIATDLYVEKLIIQQSTMTAKGLIVRDQNKSFNIFAKKEIIISAGVMGSPMLLQKSGIGPRNVLSNPILDLPVGKNFQDHVILVGIFIKLDDEQLSDDLSVDHLEVLFQYFSKQEGPLATLGTMNILGFINTQDNNAEYPDIQLHHIFFRKHDPNIKNFLQILNISPKFIMKIEEATRDHNVLMIMPIVTKPKSRGFVKVLADSTKPFIKPNYLDHEDDIKSLLAAVEYIKRFIDTKAMQDYKAVLLEFDHPCKKDNITDWNCFIEYFATPGIHGVGTCKMAKKEFGGVLDDKLRVHGIKNLRVADASIMPTITNGNTHIPSVMIGERVADFILQDL